VRKNPFRGPQPYRESDHAVFFGREEVARKLANRVLAHPCLTLYGPSGAGKSSVMQAGVIPLLVEEHDFRVVHIEGWLKDEVPLERLVRTLFQQLGVGQPPAELSPAQGIEQALALAERRSDRPILLYLDQFEQLLQPGRDAARVRGLLESLHGLARRPRRGLQLVLALREDYLGLFRDRARGRRELLEQGFRLGPLTVGEMARVVCQIAEKGEPKPEPPWSEEELRGLMRQVKIAGSDPVEVDSAEIQAAYAQIVCRMLWEMRSRGVTPRPLLAQPMLSQYLETTLDGLPPRLKEHAQVLLEKSLIDGDGNRLLLMEPAARKALEALSDEEASTVLTHLVDAAVLHKQPHQDSQYYELGHDWLARKVLERREEGELQAERKVRRNLTLAAIGATVIAVLLLGLAVWAWRQQGKAESAESRAHDYALMVGVNEHVGRKSLDVASKLLLEVRSPEQARGWKKEALKILETGVPAATLTCPEEWTVEDASFSPDGQRVLTVCRDGTVRVWRSDGTGRPVDIDRWDSTIGALFSPDSQRVLTYRGSTASLWRADGSGSTGKFTLPRDIRSGVFSPDGQLMLFTLAGTTREVGAPDRRPRLEWLNHTEAILVRADGAGPRVALEHRAAVEQARFSPDGRFVLTISEDNRAWVWKADGSGPPRVLEHGAPIRAAEFSPDGQHILTTLYEGPPRVWKVEGSGAPVVLGPEGEAGEVNAAEFSPDGRFVLTAPSREAPRVWKVDGSGAPVVLRPEGKEGIAWLARFSPDGRFVLTVSKDHTAQVWKADGSERPVALVFENQRLNVHSAEFSPDGRLVLTVSDDHAARVWRADGSGEPVVLQHGNTVESAVFSSNGRSVLTYSSDGRARLWGVTGPKQPVELRQESGFGHKSIGWVGSKPVTWDFYFSRIPRLWKSDSLGQSIVLRGRDSHSNRLESFAFSRDGRSVVTTWGDNTARVWKDDDSGRPVLLEHESVVTSAALAPDGRFIVTLLNDKTARVWRGDGSGPPGVLRHEGEVTLAAFSPDGRFIATVSTDKAVRIWKAEGSGPPVILRHEGAVTSAAFSPDGQSIVTTSNDETARVWKVDGSGQPVLFRHEGAVTSATFSPDGQSLVTHSSSGAAWIWKSNGSGLPRQLHPGNVRSVISITFSPDGRYLLSISSDPFQLTSRTVQIWKADAPGEPPTLMEIEGLTSAAFSPDSRYVVITSWGREVRVQRIDEARGFVELRYADLFAFVSFSPDSRFVAASYSDKTVRVRAADGSDKSIVLQGQESPATSVVFSPDGRSVLTTAMDGTVRVWKIEGSDKPTVLRYGGLLTSAAFSPDSRYIVTSSVDNTARTWKAEDLRPVAVFRHEDPVFSATFSPDGQSVLTTSYDGKARVWGAEGSGQPRIFQGHEGPVTSGVFSPDGRSILTTSQDGTARVWKVDGTGELAVLKGTVSNTSATFSADGRYILTTSRGGKARVWNANGTGEPVVLSPKFDVTRASFSPDGRSVLLLGGNTVWVGDVDGQGQPLALELKGAVVSAVAAPDGSRIVIELERMGLERRTQLWPLSSSEIQRVLREANRDCLSPEMRELYLIESAAEARERYAECERSAR
jgi:WD40 repeat protein